LVPLSLSCSVSVKCFSIAGRQCKGSALGVREKEERESVRRAGPGEGKRPHYY